jgi:phosphate transport system permease protein
MVKDKLIFFLAFTSTIFLFFPFTWLLSVLLIKGAPVIFKGGLEFLTGIPPLPEDGLGGIGTVLEGSIFMAIIASLISIPISILTALYIVMYEGGLFAKILRFLVDSLVEFPTIIIGISVFIIFVQNLKLGLNGISGAIALSIIMIPYTTIQAIENLRQSKDEYLEVGYSLGLTDSNVIKLILSEGREGVITGILIGIAKIFGETAPLLFTTVTSFNIFLRTLTSPITGVPSLIINFAFSPYNNWLDVAWGAALILALTVTILFTLARIFTRRKL